MRKNNFLKIFVSLVMCLTLVLSLVACGGTGEKGEKGDKGETGAAGADGVGISSVTYEAGKLVIKYTNDKTDSFDIAIESETATCDHDFSEPVELVAHAIDENGTYLRVCGKCGVANVKDEIIHDYKPTTVPATCVALGYTADVCVCGDETNKNVGTEYADHKWSTDGWIGNAVDVCTKEGVMLIQSCDVCDTAKSTATPKDGLGHVISSWDFVKDGKVVKEPTLTEAGKVVGICARCNEKEYKDLPALNSVDYGYEVVEESVSCSVAGKAKYTYDIDGFKISVTAPTETTVHSLNGKLSSELSVGVYNTRPLFSYDVENITLADDGSNATLVCGGAPVSGFYKCDACSAYVQVYVVKSHYSAAKAVGTVANCEDTVEIDIDKCDLCGKEKVKMAVYPKGHDYTITAVQSLDKKNVTVSAKCDTCEGTHSTTTIDAKYYNKIQDPTCSAFGAAKYTYTTKKDNTPSDTTDNDFTDVTVTVSGKLGKVEHTLNGKKISENAEFKYDGKFVYRTTLSGLTLFTKEGEPYACGDFTGNYGSAMYTCETCHTTQLLNDCVYKAHTGAWVADVTNGVDKNGDGKYDAEGEVAPVYLCVGTAYDGQTGNKVKYTTSCTECGTSATNTVRYEDPSAHTEVRKFDALADSKVDIYTGCETCDMKAGSTVVSAKSKVLTEASCANNKVLLYTWNDGGKEYSEEYEVKNTKLNHTIDGQKIDVSVTHNIANYPSMIAFDGLVCGDVTKVVSGMFKCEVCSANVLTSVYRGHSSADAKYANEADKPTCHEDGTLSIAKCDYCGKENVKATVEKTGCVYKAKVEVTSIDNGVVLECINCFNTTADASKDCTACNGTYTIPAVDLDLDEAKLKKVSESTCVSEGLTTYTWTVKLANQDVVVVYNKYAPTTSCDLEKVSEDKDAKLVIYFLEDKTGVGTTYYALAKCTVCGNFEVVEEFETIEEYTEWYAEYMKEEE